MNLKFTLSIFGLLFLALTSSCQVNNENTSSELTDTLSGQKKVFKRLNLDDGMGYIEGYMIGDTPDGECKFYTPNGQLMGIGNFKNGITDGVQIRYFQNGQKMHEAHEKNGMRHGNTKIWYPNGNLKTDINWKNNKQHGEVKRYYENGNIESTGNWKDDKQDGKFIKYKENGEIEFIQYFEDGVFIKEEIPKKL